MSQPLLLWTCQPLFYIFQTSYQPWLHRELDIHTTRIRMYGTLLSIRLHRIQSFDWRKGTESLKIKKWKQLKKRSDSFLNIFRRSLCKYWRIFLHSRILHEIPAVLYLSNKTQNKINIDAFATRRFSGICSVFVSISDCFPRSLSSNW